MNNKNLLVRIFDNIIAKIFLALFGVLGTILAIYSFFQDQKASLSYQIIASTNVLDFNAELSKLEVIYDSTNLKETKENLRIITIKVVNTGKKAITKEFYDENDPIGIRITSGKIIEKPEFLKASNTYISRNIKITEYQNQNITFSQLIIDPGEYFVVKLLILHKGNVLPQIFSTGKIAGQNTIKVTNLVDTNKSDNNYNLGIKIMIYVVLGIFCLGLFVLFIEGISNLNTKKKQRRQISNFKSLPEYSYTHMDDIIFSTFLESGELKLLKIKNILSKEELINQTYRKISNQLFGMETETLYELLHPGLQNPYDFGGWVLLNELINKGFLIKNDTKLTVNKSMKDSLEMFLNFISKDNKSSSQVRN